MKVAPLDFQRLGRPIGLQDGRHAVLALTTTGRKSGRARQVLLSYLDHGDAFVIAGSNAGGQNHPA